MAPTTKETVGALLADVQAAKLRRRRGEPALDAVDEYEDAHSDEDEQTLPLDFPAPPQAPKAEPEVAEPDASGSAVRFEADGLWSAACACVVLLILYVVFILSQYPL